MISLGLLGKGIAHSKSKQIYEKLYNQNINYFLFDYAEPSQIPSLDYFFSKVDGLSITAPFKKHFLNFVSVAPNVQCLDSINCIKFQNGQYVATNTDYYAIQEQVEAFILKYSSIKWVILGDGSMSRVTQQILNKKNQVFDVFSRSVFGPIENLEILKLETNSKLIVINTCGRNFSFTGKLIESSIFWDYNYNMDHHISFFQNTRIDYLDGMKLLNDQAIFATKFWNFSI